MEPEAYPVYLEDSAGRLQTVLGSAPNTENGSPAVAETASKSEASWPGGPGFGLPLEEAFLNL